MLLPARSHVSAAAALIGVLGTSATAVAATSGAPNTSRADCTSYWSWYKSGGTELGGYAKVEWTSNPCGYLIQTRVWCEDYEASPPVGFWSTSGKVKRVDLWDQAGCGALDLRGGAYVRFSYNGGSTWTAYQSY